MKSYKKITELLFDVFKLVDVIEEGSVVNDDDSGMLSEGELDILVLQPTVRQIINSKNITVNFFMLLISSI